jgi:hypothetical protein
VELEVMKSEIFQDVKGNGDYLCLSFCPVSSDKLDAGPNSFQHCLSRLGLGYRHQLNFPRGTPAAGSGGGNPFLHLFQIGGNQGQFLSCGLENIR